MKKTRLLALAALFLTLLAIPAKAQDNVANTARSIASEPVSLAEISIWNGGFEKTNWAFIIGYVNKSWRCTYPDNIQQREDFFGDPDAKFIHGLQIGAQYTPSFDWGLGLRTGLFFESYVSRSRWITEFCHHFAESDLYIPLHASYRLPLDNDMCFNIFGGMGFQWAMAGRYFKQVGTVWPGGWWWRRPIPVYINQRHEYGNGWPQQVNWQAEVGLNFQFKEFMLSFTYSFGLVDHGIENTFDEGKTYVTSITSRQDKMQASIAFVL